MEDHREVFARCDEKSVRAMRYEVDGGVRLAGGRVEESGSQLTTPTNTARQTGLPCRPRILRALGKRGEHVSPDPTSRDHLTAWGFHPDIGT